MLYRLAFGITPDGYLRVTRAAKGEPVLSTIYLNDQVFATAVKIAGTTPFRTLRILEAARLARLEPGVDIHCEAVELTTEQIDILCSG